MSFQHQMIDTNGIQLHVVQAGDPSHPLVILLHGFPECGHMWRDQIAPLVQAGYYVWVPDQRGYHLSDKPKGIRSYTLDTLAEDVVGLMDAAGKSQAIVVAHDWGGAVAWWVANKYPERVQKLVAINVPNHRAFAKMLGSSWRQRIKSTYAFLFQLPYLPEFIMGVFNYAVLANGIRRTSRNAFDADTLKTYKLAWSQPGALTAMVNWYRALRFPRSELPSKRIPMPTLILWGQQDAFFHRQLAPMSLDYCDDGRIQYLDGTHWVVEEQPQVVSQKILDFLQAP